MEPGDHQHVRQPGQREPLAQSFADTAAVADHQRAHLAALFANEVGVDKAADSRTHRGDLRGRKLAAVTDCLKPRAGARVQHHRSGDSLARQVGRVIELARIAEVARKAQHAGDPHLVADPHVRRRSHNGQPNRVIRSVKLGRGSAGALDVDEYVFAVRVLLRGAVDSSLERERGAVGKIADAMR